MQGYGCRGGSELLTGLVAMEMARTDASIADIFRRSYCSQPCFPSILPVQKSKNKVMRGPATTRLNGVLESRLIMTATRSIGHKKVRTTQD